MQTVLAAESLRTNELLSIECVVAPDAAREVQIRPLLAHKPPNYLEHIDAALAGRCDDLETRFYLGLIDGEPVANVMTVETQGVGILGHVFTRPEQRRKGICDRIFHHLMIEFRQRNGRVLLLGTGYQSPAYRIYERHGFRDWPVGPPGCMRYDTAEQGSFEAQFFARARYTPVKAGWKHWPLIALLATVPTPVHLRSLTLNFWGVRLLEGPYCQFMHRYANRSETRAAVLQTETGAVVAMATCVPDSRWPGVHLLDLFAHPAVDSGELPPLLSALDLPAGKINSYVDSNDMAKLSALEACGFSRTAVLPEQYSVQNEWRDVWLFARD